MKKHGILAVILGMLTVTASTAWAGTITAFLDSPANRTGVAGIETVHGWAFATNDTPRVSLPSD